MHAPSEMSASKRLQREYRQFYKEKHNDMDIFIVQSCIFECHFSFRGAPDTDFADGIYHGKFVFPYDYPKNPPELYFLTV